MSDASLFDTSQNVSGCVIEDEQHTSLFERALEGIFQIDRQGHYLKVNTALARICGYESTEALLLAQPIVNGQFYVNTVCQADLLQRVTQAGQVTNYECQAYRRDRSVMWLSITCWVLRKQNGLFACYEGFVKDITEQRRQTEATLQRQNEKLQTTLKKLQQAQDGLVQADKMGVLGQLIAGIAHEINTPLGAIQASSSNAIKALESSLPKLPELFALLEPQQIHLVFTLIEQSLQTTALTTARERRQQRRSLTQQLAALEVNKADTIADTLVDMGITANIVPYLPLLQSENSLFIVDLAYDLARIKSNSQTIQQAVGQASNVVKALQSFAYKEHTGQKKLAQVSDSVETVLTLYRNQLKHGIELTRHYENIPPILCYHDELGQIWTNLIQNSIHAMGGKGEIAIAIQRRPSTRGNDTGDSIVVGISDNGPGIPPEIISHVFDPFFTTKPIGEGTGLGLNISRKIVQKHEGWITVASEPGHTCFEIWLPIGETGHTS